MDSDDLFWLRCWQSAFVLTAVAILTTGSCTMHRNVLINQSISEGYSPLEVVCAYGADNNQSICLMQAAKNTP